MSRLIITAEKQAVCIKKKKNRINDRVKLEI